MLNFDISVCTQVPIIAVYKNTIDYPNLYVARLWDSNIPTNQLIYNKRITPIRMSIPEYMIKLKPHKDDDPKIIEIWM